jgi:hypothetical protein
MSHHVKHNKYPMYTTATQKYWNITSPRIHRSLHKVVVLRTSFVWVKHRSSKLFSWRGVALWVQNLQNIDTNVLDDYKTHEIESKFYIWHYLT